MRALRWVLMAAVPVLVVVIAFLNASAVMSLVEATIGASPPPASERRALLEAARAAPSADAILDRNPFDHVTGSLRPRETKAASATEPRAIPVCDGVRALVLVGDEDQGVALAALDAGGKRILRRRGGEVGDRRIVYIGRERVWLEGQNGLCQAPLFGGNLSPSPSPKTQLDIASHIEKTGEHEWAIDRPTLDRILESQSDFAHVKVVPEVAPNGKVGAKLLTIRPGSVLSLVGLESGDRIDTINGFEIGTPEEALTAYARLRQADRLSIQISRGGAPRTLEYVIR